MHLLIFTTKNKTDFIHVDSTTLNTTDSFNKIIPDEKSVETKLSQWKLVKLMFNSIDVFKIWYIIFFDF